PAPYGPFSLPKLLGVPGGVLLTFGAAGLAWLKTRGERHLGAEALWGGEMAFVLLLLAVAASGLALYAATGTGWMPALLALHLGSVLAFFLLVPYSKMVHGFFRLAALARDAQQRNPR
ncbi:MAG: 4Fe-4S ferredoxin, partial [Rhodobacterales bacterium]|nr:4Fe-4S ferredoxin [Rhodobacterales bacterium]